MIEDPVVTAVTKPVDEPIVAIPGLLLVHDPPGVASLSNVVEPIHKVDKPVIGAGP